LSYLKAIKLRVRKPAPITLPTSTYGNESKDEEGLMQRRIFVECPDIQTH